MYDFKEIFSQFQLYGNFVIAVPYGTGHINDTFLLTADQSGALVRYIVQRVNTGIFRQPAELMDNFVAVTRHIDQKIKAAKANHPALRRATLQVIRARDGKPYFENETGFFRCYCFVENARTYDILETETQAYQAACAFGQFQSDLADLPVRLHETIPDFHHTPARLRQLEAAIAANPCGRLKSVMPEVDFILSRRDDCGVLLKLQQSGDIIERTTHNDTKLNNVLIDDLTGQGCCVIDLDTVMPGLPHYDFGDMVRTGTSPAAEDERDLTKVVMRFGMYESLLRGFLATAGSFLNPVEREMLPFAGKLITLEIGIRFLTDYLEGDRYFKTKRPGHNLDRCRTQLKLVQSIEEQLPQMQKMLKNC